MGQLNHEESRIRTLQIKSKCSHIVSQTPYFSWMVCLDHLGSCIRFSSPERKEWQQNNTFFPHVTSLLFVFVCFHHFKSLPLSWGNIQVCKGPFSRFVVPPFMSVGLRCAVLEVCLVCLVCFNTIDRISPHSNSWSSDIILPSQSYPMRVGVVSHPVSIRVKTKKIVSVCFFFQVEWITSQQHWNQEQHPILQRPGDLWVRRDIRLRRHQ